MSINTETWLRTDALYTLDSAGKPVLHPEVMNVMNAHTRTDATEGNGLYFQRQLEYIDPILKGAKLPTLNAFTMLPVTSDVPIGYNTYTVRMEESRGEARYVGSSTNEVPLVDGSVFEDTYHIKDIELAYGWTWKEIEAANVARMPLSTSKLSATRRGLNEKLNRMAWFGDESAKVKGVLNNDYIPRRLLATPMDSTQTGDTILAALNALVDSPDTLTLVSGNQPGVIDRLLLPSDVYTYIKNTPRTSTSDTSILQYFMDKHEGMQVFRVPELNAAGPNSEPVIVAFRYDTDVIRLEVPRLFEQLPMVWDGTRYKFTCISTMGGVSSVYPFEAVIGILPS